MYGAGSDPTKPTATGFPVSYSTSTTYTTTNDTSSYAPPAPPQPKPIVEWSTGLCDCFSDCGNCNFHNLHSLLLFTTYITDLLQFDWLLCEIYGKLFVSGCLTWWCPCITFGRIAEIVDRGSSSCGSSGALYTLVCCVTCCACIYSCFYRSKMRRQHGLKGNGCTDCLIHCCCEPCALCQEYRELESRGFDMIIGWHGNVEQRSRGVAMTALTAPSVEQSMNR
ncbi:hypothetical protein LR48_Vigan325s000700 [Vigna angularis]|uniref:Protein PLANT CADMIUM RESISTANCE 3 n=1 Tax=Phaseolus angularis TaxID=3914 RepID=A0A0L9T899_PHAAN|nr:Protein PLANT CADMIUM RESISTANCE 3 [Vigna angularis]KOM26835.1 hypothetical protein LR48_Vigan325s000700 [Vigna angularis]